jgi:hypothetical protein
MGIGMLGALLGGAAGGWGKGQMEAIKAKREEQLKALDRQFQGQQNDLNRAVQERQITSQEKLTTAQLGVTRELGLGQIANQKAIAELQEGGANTRTTQQITSAEKIAENQNILMKDLKGMELEGAQLLNTKPVTYTYKDAAGKDQSITRMTRPDGKILPDFVDEKGNRLSILTNDNDTPEIKNVKQLMQLGVPQATAMKLAYPQTGDGALDRAKLEKDVLTSLVSGASTMKNLTEEDNTALAKQAKTITEAGAGAVDGRRSQHLRTAAFNGSGTGRGQHLCAFACTTEETGWQLHRRSHQRAGAGVRQHPAPTR